MFAVFANHAIAGADLMFTSGPSHAEAVGVRAAFPAFATADAGAGILGTKHQAALNGSHTAAKQHDRLSRDISLKHSGSKRLPRLRSNGERRSVSLLMLTCSRWKRELEASRDRKALNLRVARDVAYLKTFDDRILADIGLNRSEIEAYVHRRLHQD